MPALLQKVGEFAISNYLEFGRVMPQGEDGNEAVAINDRGSDPATGLLSR